MTAALEGGEWSAARPDRTLPPGKTRYTFYRRLGGPQGRCGRAENLVPTGIRSRTVQPVAQSLYRLSYPVHHLFLYLDFCGSEGSICSASQPGAVFNIYSVSHKTNLFFNFEELT